MIVAFLLHHWFLVCIVSQFLVGVVFTYPVSLAHLQRGWPIIAYQDRTLDVVVSLCVTIIPWFIGVPAMLLSMFSHRHGRGWKGFMWWPQ